MAMPATAALIGTPASMRARDAPATEAMDEEPLDSRIWETTRMVEGEVFRAGQHGQDGPFGQSAVADIPTRRAAQQS